MHSKQEKIKSFDPNSVGNTSTNIFGLPFSTSEADVIILPVPWDITATNKYGSSKGPEEIFNSTPQIGLYNPVCPDAWKAGIAMEEIPQHILKINKNLQQKASVYRQFIQNGGDVEQNKKMAAIRDEINKESAGISNEVKFNSKKHLGEGKYVGVLGGDHSVPLGLIRALSEKYTDFGILHIDAHSDLYKDYEGLGQSHASIIYNTLPIKEVKNIVQVGIRELSHEENNRIIDNRERIKVFSNDDIKTKLYNGNTWDSICREIISELPENVYVTFDIDGLEPSNCPSTGTPVPGGLAFDEAMYLLDLLAKNNRSLIGFDLVEVVPGVSEIDAIIGARVLYKLITIMVKTNNLIS